MESQIVKEIINLDSSFDEAMFKSYVDNIFVKIYTAIMLDELESVKHFMSNTVYQQYQQKLAKLNEKNLRQMYDELNVKSTTIIDFKSTKTEFQITVKLISRYMDYFLKKDTGDYVSGNNQSRVEKNNILTFAKKRTFLTQSSVRKCPGCGASISVNTNGICAYCGTTYNLADYNYILESIATE